MSVRVTASGEEIATGVKSVADSLMAARVSQSQEANCLLRTFLSCQRYFRTS
jgi:hypothetical protein